MILFESDFEPKKLLSFIKFDNENFAINYDLGNSASLSFNIEEEFKYMENLKNIHIKDRIINGKTVDWEKEMWILKIFYTHK